MAGSRKTTGAFVSYPAPRAWIEQDCAVSKRGYRRVGSFDRDDAQRKSIQSADGNLPDGWVGSAIVISDQPIIVLVVLTRYGGRDAAWVSLLRVVAGSLVIGQFLAPGFFLALAGMDVGTSFGGIGSSREAMIATLAEPAFIMIVFTLALVAGSTQLSTVAGIMLSPGVGLRVSLGMALIALVIVALAENARMPVDNPATHLELTMIHEALILEYSARHLALIEWATAIKLTVYCTIGIALFVPGGIVEGANWLLFPGAAAILLIKLAAAGTGLAVLEAVSAKMRIFRAPEFLGMAFLFAVLGMLIRQLLGA